MTDRELILAALADNALRESSPTFEPGQAGAGTAEDLWKIFEEALTPLGGKMVSTDGLKSLLKGGCYVDQDARPLLPCVPARNVSNVWDADVGITVADLAVAETGSLLVSAGPGRARLASLAPPLHIVLVPKSSIVATLNEAFARLANRTSVLITGTSRTADIEGVLVRGVHGPRDLWVVPIKG